MLTLKQIIENTDAVVAGLEKKHFPDARTAIEKVIALDQTRRAAQKQKDALAAEMNKLSKQIGAYFKDGNREAAEAAKEQTADLKENIKHLEDQMTTAE